jgi:uncharacterized protein (DUF849 family)
MSILVQGALNGPRLALTPRALAREARAAVDAGARSLHVHPYGHDGQESIAADDVAAAVAAIRAACPEVELGVSTGEWIAADVPAAIATWRDPLPDMASVNLSEARHAAVMHALLARGIAIEAGIFSVDDVPLLVATGLAARCRRILVEIDSAAGDQAAQAAAIDAALDEAGVDGVPRLHHGHDAGTWDVLREAVGHGIDVRVGLEDTTVLPDGAHASANGPLVAAAIALL